MPSSFRLPPARLLSPQLVVPGRLQGQLEGTGILAAVHVGAGGRGEGKVGGREQIAPPQLGGVDPQLACGQVDDPLQRHGRFGAASPPEGPHRRGVGDCGGRLVVDGGNAVGPRRHQHGVGGQDRTDGRVGAHIGGDVDPDPAERSVGAEAELDIVHVVPALAHVDEVLAASLDPLDGPSQAPGQPRHHDELRVHDGLGAEAAAHRRGDHPHLLRGRFEGRGHHVAHLVGPLRSAPQRHGCTAVAVGGCGQRGGRLDGGPRHPMVDEAGRHHLVVA